MLSRVPDLIPGVDLEEAVEKNHISANYFCDLFSIVVTRIILTSLGWESRFRGKNMTETVFISLGSGTDIDMKGSKVTETWI